MVNTVNCNSNTTAIRLTLDCEKLTQLPLVIYMCVWISRSAVKWKQCG